MPSISGYTDWGAGVGIGQLWPGGFGPFGGDEQPGNPYVFTVSLPYVHSYWPRSKSDPSHPRNRYSCRRGSTLFVWDARPAIFPAGAHDFLGAFPLAMIAFAYLLYQWAHRPSLAESIKDIT